MSDSTFLKLLVLVNSAVPITLLLWDVYRGRVGANPLEFVTRTTGMLTLIFLLLTLAITPVRKITGVNQLSKIRRMVGLFAFFYGAAHLLTYIWFDRFFNLKSVVGDIVRRPFIAIGMTAFFLMVPLAITSTNKMIKRLGGKQWIRLHRLAYLAAILGVLHFWMLVKSDTRLPLTFAFMLVLLLGHRLMTRYFPPPGQTPRTTIFSRR